MYNSKECYLEEMRISCKHYAQGTHCFRVCRHIDKLNSFDPYKISKKWGTNYGTERPLYVPDAHIKRQATRRDCLPSLLGDGNKCSEIVYG
jgi:hypothetical protein